MLPHGHSCPPPHWTWPPDDDSRHRWRVQTRSMLRFLHILSTKRHRAIVSVRGVGGPESNQLTYHVGQVEAIRNSHGSTHGGWNRWPQGSRRTSVPRAKSSIQMAQPSTDGSVGDGGRGTIEGEEGEEGEEGGEGDNGDVGDGGSETNEGDGGNGAWAGNSSSFAVGWLVQHRTRPRTRLHRGTTALGATNGSCPPISGSY